MNAVLRPARPTDAGATGDILWRFQAETGWMPKLHTGAETIAFCGEMIDRGWVTVAEVDDQVQGFLSRDGEEICALYLSQRTCGQGIGMQLIQNAKAQTPRLWLRTLAANTRARQFYRHAGFAETGKGDGGGNDENLPDIVFVWPKEPKI